MLHQKDFILRLIEQIGASLIRVRNQMLRLREGDDAAEVDAELNALASKSGVDLGLLRSLTPESLALMAAPGGEMDAGRCWLWAEILYLDALGAVRRGDARAAGASRERSLHLYRLLEPRWAPAPDLPRAEERVREMEEWAEGRGREAP